ncbi:nicotinate phosphoribosyltransferase [Neptuniibacter sp. QD37_11]|uniref:nicotinate phosphoribosyltransferase n=1 Tax=Neptuniibacter sp. QD37_11 TaxID=3398209 RepID=UPI0039F525A3
MKTNIILNTDSYKLSHYKQYPPGTEYVFSYIESRGGAFDDTLFFGLQKALIELNENFPDWDDFEEAKFIAEQHGEPFNEQGWKDLIELGYFPIKVRAIPEGSVTATKNVLVGIVNTLPEFYWLTSYLEPYFLRAVWYPTTVATLSFECKKIIKRFMEATCDNLEGLPFKLHDFGARGVSSEESAGIGGAAHLVNFMGTDTLSAIRVARKFYDAGVCGYSIPATEHSTITAWGREGEAAAYRNILKQFPTGLVACVSDSYDIFNAVENIWGDELRMAVTERDGTLVIRPDSGDPIEVIPVLLESLGRKFGYSTNAKGYKVLNSKVRLIQGDGVNLESIGKILEVMAAARWSAENIAFGMGGGLLQQLDRDTLKFAMKTSAVRINGEWVEVYKDPITDSGKRSKRGVQDFVNGQTVAIDPELIFSDNPNSDMQTVYENGKLMNAQSFTEIRDRADAAA